MRDVAAFVLAGGKSSRMGQDKAALALAGKTLLERAVGIARAASGQVGVVGSGESTRKIAAQLGLPIVVDVFSDQGPLAGIHAALESQYARGLNFILAVDTPVITPQFVRYIVKRACSSEALVTVARAGGILHPLCAVYRREFVKRAQAALREHRNKIEAAFDQAALDVISEADLAACDFDPEMFANINTPADLIRAQSRLSS
jgi:molybdopterin-guanine dinucleotide biosynthesis protein A